MLVTGFELIAPLSTEDGGFFVDYCADLHAAFKIYRIVINLPKFHTAKHLSHSDNSFYANTYHKLALFATIKLIKAKV